ncbi:DUF3606 domain-containing protein [Pseudomonas frederiksbergensis]|uniref:DUF3606 domain-containing protein n=1 Tax=Pseudomonas frederiksbergensis TaxID=104087 RepID=A0A6L5C471_9PSED|nr:DUF3606 domain-containing protein [Pseudomonas frederiksbergensis]KAF2395380.1 hypothetical protein FX983_03365 [Pseudomonas frederiksbergensis]
MEKRQLMLGTDQIRINIKDRSELLYWSKKFGVSKDELKSAVKAVGESLTAVQNQLKQLQSA